MVAGATGATGETGAADVAVAPAAVAAAMWAADRASQAAGMVVEEVRLGYARLAMTVRADMVNGHGISHGGYLFLLADSAMAYASNSHNAVAVATSADIDFLSPAREGERLLAEATDTRTGGRSALTDVVVTASDGRRVAVFRGRTTKVAGTIVSPS